MGFRLKIQGLIVLNLFLFLCQSGVAQGKKRINSFSLGEGNIQKKLQQSLRQFSDLQKRKAAALIPLNRELAEKEQTIRGLRALYRTKSRSFDNQVLEIQSLSKGFKEREARIEYLLNLLGQFLREYQSRIHDTELETLNPPLQKGLSLLENESIGSRERARGLVELIQSSEAHINQLAGGRRFEGFALDPTGKREHGDFALIGPFAYFRSKRGKICGLAETRLNSTEPSVLPFSDPQIAAGIKSTIETGTGAIPVDPSLGNARKIEETHESLVEHMKKGGPVMIPILLLALFALIVSLLKWIQFMMVPKPKKSKLKELFLCLRKEGKEGALERVKQIPGPLGRMLKKGLQNLGENKEVMEEAMFEEVLHARIRFQRWLPFVAVSAASAPLLGLLGTVTGIINTFKLITVFGSSDVKTLSGGISEALITTEFGLIVAIPSLLIHAYLSRKAKRDVDKMETVALTLINETGKAQKEWNRGESIPFDDPVVLDREKIKDHVDEILREMLNPLIVANPREGIDL